MAPPRRSRGRRLAGDAQVASYPLMLEGLRGVSKSVWRDDAGGASERRRERARKRSSAGSSTTMGERLLLH